MPWTHDLVIRGGLVVDGAGGAPFEADVGVEVGVISAIGTASAPGARRSRPRGAW